VTLHRAVQEQVALVAISTSEGLNHIADMRREEIENLKDELATLEENVRLLDEKSK
jgi:hypothetical protein